MRTANSKIKWASIVYLGVILAMTGCQKDLLRKETLSSALTKKALAANIAEEIDLVPAGDAYVQDGSSAGTNYGGNTWLIAKDDAPGYRRVIYLRFDLTPLSGASTIQAARIELVGGVSNAADTANAKWSYYTTTDKDWDEKTINWNNAPTAGTKIGEVNGKFKVNNSVVYFDIPASVLQNALDTDGKLSIKIEAQRKVAGTPSFYSDFQSKETQNVDLRPRLKVNYIGTSSGFYSNLVMDKVTFDSIQFELSTSAQAQALINDQVTLKANQALSAAPAPVTKISDPDGKNKVQTDAAKVYSLALQYFLFQEQANAGQYVDKAKEFLLSWAAVNAATSQTPDESIYLPFLTGYSLIRAKIDANSRMTIDNWLRTRYNFYKTQSVRTNNWETIRNLLMIDIAYILNDGTLINQATSDFSTHHNKNYRADGASVDFLGRDAFAYHVYDMEFIGQIGRTFYIKRGRHMLDSLVNHRATKWVNLRINPNDTPVLGGSIRDAVSFMAPYVLDPDNNVHLEFVNTEWAPDKTRSDYNKPFNAAGSSYAFVQMASIMKSEMFGFLKKLNPSFNRYTDLRYYINSYGPSLSTSPMANVTLYGDIPFRGWYKQLGIGSYSLTDLQGLGVTNDQLSSISIPKGFKVTLYENGDFTGNSVLLTGHTIDLSILNFNDKTSSLLIEYL
ncbi:hypothetical protein BWD42_19800 [Sphingobacterium sp. CZ-UAM]|uniref:CBM96 family carbohydrate-binding protein n=1 Tax=Sphingobacterium sp. CZ-UAM TaxID=1933868 RepID=UPI0009876ED7|nr:DNRLRE domain-containing protein [Sphingobacterium sp. CZ-UAM]OOG16485.1 hypothetical protein BWD42_19800 [Sphingobacterium sp. CZ-UAM]